MATLSEIQACLMPLLKTESIVLLIARDAVFLTAISSEWREDEFKSATFDMKHLQIHFEAGRDSSKSRQVCLNRMSGNIVEQDVSYTKIKWTTFAGSAWLEFDEEYSSFTIYASRQGLTLTGNVYTRCLNRDQVT